jgi:hypothetical protein
MSDHLVDMKLTKKEAKHEIACDSPKGPRYPYGLQIDLDDEALKKLGFTSLPDVGDEFIVVGVGPVTSVHEREDEDGTDRRFQIQLQKLEVGPAVAGAATDTALAAVSKGVEDANKSKRS